MSTITYVLCVYLLQGLVYPMECLSDRNHSNIAIFDADKMSPLLFNTFYFNQKPVIINSNVEDWYSNIHFFDIETLYQHYGENSFEYGTSIDLAMVNRASKTDDITLKLYLKKKKYKNYLIFDPHFIANNADRIGLKSLDILHDELHKNDKNAYTFTLGKVGSGISFQSHGNLWLHQIAGITKIFLYPPVYSPVGGALDWNSYTSLQWEQYILPHLTEEIKDIHTLPHKEIWDSHLNRVFEVNITSVADIFDTEKQPFFNAYKPFECTLSEGQLLYIPKLWWYSTLNIENEKHLSISMMMQTDDIPKEAALARRMYHDPLRNFHTGFEYLYRNSDPIGAQLHLTKALLLDPTFISGYIALSDIYIHSAQKHKEHLDTVIKFLSTAYLLNPEYDVARENLMRILEQKGESELVEKIKNKLPLS